MVSASANALGALQGLSNNTASQWWRDPGLLRLQGILLAILIVPVTSGYDNSLINNLQSLATFLSTFDSPSASTLGLVGAAGTIGGAIGTWPAAYISDRFGRRNCLCFGSVVCVAGAFMQTFSYHVEQFAIGRAVLSFGSSHLLVAGVSLANEIAHPRLRGRMVGFYNVIWYIGAFVAAWLCYGMKLRIVNDWQWRVPTVCQVVPALWTFSLRFWIPESPRWLISKGRTEEAAAILYRYHANGDTQDEMVSAQLLEIKEIIRLEKEVQAGVTWKSAFSTPGNRKRMIVVAMFATSVAWTSQSIVSYYNSAIYSQAGITSGLQQIGLNGGLTVVDFFSAFGGALLSGYIGRRTLILIGFGGMLGAHIVVTVLAAQYASSHQAAEGYALVAFIWIESVFYNIGLNPMTYAYPAELMSFALRAKGVAWFLLISDLNGIVTRYCNPIGLANLTYWYYVIYCFFYVFSIAGVWFFYPETRNKTLEEIELMLDGTTLEIVPPITDRDVENVLLAEPSSKGVEAQTEVAELEKA